MTIRQQQADPLAALLGPLARRVEADIETHLVEPGCPDELAEAMRYCALGGGKRLRPAMVHLAAAAVGAGDDELTARAAVAIELVHCYSLVHDDLPAMDDDTLRRGRPTAHVKFGQAMAILAGDALLTRAFAVLTEGPRGVGASSAEIQQTRKDRGRDGLATQGQDALATAAGLDDPRWPGAPTPDARAAALVWELACASGQAGMIAGQVADMSLCPLAPGVEGLRYVHLRKTAALIRAASRMGAICGRASDEQVKALGRYGLLLGLAFQVADDVLDVTSTAGAMGKTPGKDAAAGKRTYVSEMGVERATHLGAELTDAAVAALATLGHRGEPLADLARHLTGRAY
jgi:geranylgeranyl pyrophosphate synthase